MDSDHVDSALNPFALSTAEETHPRLSFAESPLPCREGRVFAGDGCARPPPFQKAKNKAAAVVPVPLPKREGLGVGKRA